MIFTLKLILIKGTVSRDWEELKMIERDKSHLFTVAG